MTQARLHQSRLLSGRGAGGSRKAAGRHRQGPAARQNPFPGRGQPSRRTSAGGNGTRPATWCHRCAKKIYALISMMIGRAVSDRIEDEGDGGEGGIRTHVPLSRQIAFEAIPVRPLRYLSALARATALANFELKTSNSKLRSERSSYDRVKNSWRRSLKNSCTTALHSAASTPATTTTRWLSAGCSCARCVLSTAPAFGSVAP